MIRLLIDIYIYLIIADVIMSYIPDIREYQVVQYVHKIADFPQKYVRRYLGRYFPPELPLDPSPIVVILALNLLMFLW